MPVKSAVYDLPEDVRAELDSRLIGSGFQDYRALETWLTEHGHHISKSALHRYGQRFEARVERLRIASQQAQAIVAASPDDADAMGEALLNLIKERLFSVLLAIPDEVTPESLAKLTRAIADISRASVGQKKWAVEVRQKAAAAAEEAEDIGRKGGLSDAAAADIRRLILGIAE